MTKKIKEKFEIFSWNKNLEIGIEEIDIQHKKLVDLINELANNLTTDQESQIAKTFEKLANYADYHFKSEEEVWKNNINDKYLLDSHKSTHDSFLPKVLEIQEKNKDKSFHEVTEEILLFLIRWLAYHIIDEDKRFSIIIKYLNEGNSVNDSVVKANNILGVSMKELIETMLSMYDELSLKTINLIREKHSRVKAEEKLYKLNQELKKLAITDQLTGIYNRRYFDDVTKREIERTKRVQSRFNLILFDIDYFKKLNDTYGHQYGDIALVKLANCLKEVYKRASDYVFRIGGEEFAILVVEDSFENVVEHTKTLVNEIEKLQIENKNSLVSKYLTISGSVVSLIPNKNDTIEDIFKKADEKLYDSKANGRNKFTSLLI